MSVEGSAKNPERELRRKWQSLQVADMREGQGKIKNMQSHGKAGFISGDDGKDCYFKVSSYRRSRHLLE
jgi:hypothetical protein